MAAITGPAPGFWGGSYTLLSNDKAALSYMVRRELKKRGLLSERATLPVLTGNAVGAGGNVNAGYNRIQYGNTANTLPGGVQPVESVVVHTGPTTAADEASVDSFSVLQTQPAYVRNGDGNPRGSNGG